MAGAPPLSRESIEALRAKGLVGDDTVGRYENLYPTAPEPTDGAPSPEPTPPPASTPAPKADPFADIFADAEAKRADDQAAEEARDAEKQRAKDEEELPKLRAKVQADVADLMKAGKSRGEIENLRMSDLMRLKRLEEKAAREGGSVEPASFRTAEVKPTDTAPAGALVSDGAPAGAAPAPRAFDPTAAAGSYTRGFDMQAAGIKMASETGQAKAAEMAAMQGRVAKEDEDRLKASQAAEQERQAKLDESFKTLEAEATNLGTLKVDPDRFWAKKGSGEKVMAGIGLVLGAFGSGGNKGVKVITDAIDRDIDAQKADIQTAKDVYTAKNGLYAKMVERFKDKRAAEEATRLAYLNNAELKIREIEARYGGAEVKSKAQVALGEIQVKKDEVRQKFAAAMSRTAPVNDPTMNGIMQLPKELQKPAIEEKGKADEWNALTADIKSTFNEFAKLGASAKIPSMLGGSSESYDAARGKMAGAIVGKVPGIKSDSDFNNIVAPMLPKPGESAAEAAKKAKIFDGFLRANAPATPILNGYGLRPEAAVEKLDFKPGDVARK